MSEIRRLWGSPGISSRVRFPLRSGDIVAWLQHAQPLLKGALNAGGRDSLAPAVFFGAGMGELGARMV